MEDRPRAVCPACSYIDYVNPIAVVGTVPVFGGDGWSGTSILLCRRAIQPRLGLWTLPAGFLEYGETLAAGAERETDEEAGAQVSLGPIFSVLDVPDIGQIHVFFLARLADLQVHPGPDTLEARAFDMGEIPWDELAFRTVTTTLRHYLDDCASGEFGLHTGVIGPRPGPASTGG